MMKAAPSTPKTTPATILPSIGDLSPDTIVDPAPDASAKLAALVPCCYVEFSMHDTILLQKKLTSWSAIRVEEASG